MNREARLELQVGAIVLAAVLVLSFFVASISDLSFVQKGQEYPVIFNFANGLRDAAPVRLAGIEAGLVRRLEIITDNKDSGKTKVKVHVWVKEGIQIPADSTITINQLGLLGEKYIEIIPGQSATPLQPGTLMAGQDPVAMEKITKQVSSITEKLEVTINQINEGLLSAQNQKNIATILDGLASVAVSLKEGRGTVGRLLKDDAIFKNIEELSGDLKANPWKLLYRPKK